MVAELDHFPQVSYPEEGRMMFIVHSELTIYTDVLVFLFVFFPHYFSYLFYFAQMLQSDRQTSDSDSGPVADSQSNAYGAGRDITDSLSMSSQTQPI